MPANYGEPIKIYDFSKGLWLTDPAELMPDGATPDARSVWYDEKKALSKMPGTSLLLAEANNEFSHGETQRLFVYRDLSAGEKLIYQGMNSGNTAMSLWSLDRQSSYPAAVSPTDITPDSGLTLYRPLSMVNYRGKLYISDGSINLKRWDGTEWEEYHADQHEQFKYLCVYRGALFGACSGHNPTRVVWTDVNACNFFDYYSSNKQWMDFPTVKGDPVQGMIVSPKGTLLVFKYYSIHEITGNPGAGWQDVMSQSISMGKGTVDIRTVRVWGDNVVFMWKHYLCALGNSNVAMSREDQRIQAESNIKPIGSEIRDFMTNYVTLPDLGQAGKKVYSDYVDWCDALTFVNGTDATNFKADDVGIEDDDTIAGGTSDETADVVHVELASGSWTAGTAAGTLYLTNVSGTFTVGEDILLGYHSGTHAPTTSVKFAEVGTHTAGWTLWQCRVNRPEISTSNPDVINFGFSEGYIRVGPTYTTQDQWVKLRSGAGKNQYNSQSFKLTYPSDNPIPENILIYTKEVGDVSDVTLKVYVCDGKNSDTEPDFDHVYGEGQIRGVFAHGIEVLTFDSGSTEPEIGDRLDEGSGDGRGTVHKVVRYAGTWAGGDAEGVIYMKGVTGTWTDDAQINVNGGQSDCATVNGGDTDPIGTACWLACEMDYWDYPQNLYDGTGPAKTTFLAIKSTGDTSSNYFQWGYHSAGTYSDGRMYNSDDQTPPSQEDCDYAFKVNGVLFHQDATIETGTIDGGNGLTRWDKMFVTLDTATLGGYTRTAELEKVEYEVRGADSGWGTWTETTNGGEITGSGQFLRLKLTIRNPSGLGHTGSDSFTLRSVTATYLTQTLIDLHIDSEVFEDRYWLSCKIVDGTVQPS